MSGVCIAFATALCSPLATAYAEQKPADVAYATGVTEFRKGGYAASARAFEKALRLGRSDGAVYYNLGSAYYRLGWWSKAEPNFLRAAKFSGMRELSWFNLGLVAMRREDWLRAADWFARVAASSAPENLKLLSQTALAQVREGHRDASLVHLRLNGGHNGNVLGLSDATLSPSAGQRAAFVETQAGYDSKRALLGRYGVRASGWLSSIRYRDLSDANVTVVGGGLTFDHSASRGTWGLAAGAGRLWYGGEEYENYSQVSISRSLSMDSFEGQMGYEWMRHSSLKAADPGLSGAQGTLALDAAWRIGKGRPSVGYQQERNSRNVDVFSPSRNEYRAGWNFEASRKNLLSLRYSLRDSEYPAAGSTRRSDRQRQLVAEWQHRSNPKLYGLLRIQHTRNASTAAGFSYSQDIALIGLGSDY
jgi:hypothetical protein